ncbi:MAG: winged helix-turn-helix domain-containing protein [Nitrososphaeraceae archaeon]
MGITLISHINEKDLKNRSRVEIAGLILQAVDGGCSSKSQIMYKAFLGHAQTRDYVQNLTDIDLLIYNLSSHTYELTEKGKMFIQFYDEIDDMINLSQLSEQGKYQAGVWEEIGLHRNEK